MTTTTIHDTGESYSSPAWPIRVGARYRALKGPLHSPEPLAITFHVTTIDGDHIHYTLTHDGQTEPYTVKESPAVLFRRLCLPEDASPCTALYKALRAVIAETEPCHQNDTAGRPWLAQALQLLDEEEAHTHEHHG